MLAKKISYTDFDGNTRTEEFYFNLTKAEILEMQLSTNGGLDKMIENIISAQDTAKLISLFKDIVLKSYGRKTPDGKGFEKSEELTKEFVQTNAYSDLFMELATDSDAAAAFINGIVPRGLAEEASKVATPKLVENK